jgi:hypothetical protein
VDGYSTNPAVSFVPLADFPNAENRQRVMSKFQPPGRLSKVSGQDYMIQIQTEFAWTPHPRITTCVMLDGVILHKIQKDWEGNLDTDEDRKVVSRIINKQHDEVDGIVNSNQDFILNYIDANKKDTDFSTIIEIEGVRKAFLLTPDGLMTPFREEEIEIEKVQLFERLFELVEFLDKMTRWGGMQESYLVLDEDKIMIFKYKDNFLIITIDDTASPKETAKKVVELLKAA